MAKIPPITITIYPPDGDGKMKVEVQNASPEHGRPSEGPPGAAGTPASASGDEPVDFGRSDEAATEKARQLLRVFGYHKPERALKEFGVARIIEVCEQAHKQRDEIRDLPAWINRALWRHFTF